MPNYYPKEDIACQLCLWGCASNHTQKKKEQKKKEKKGRKRKKILYTYFWCNALMNYCLKWYPAILMASTDISLGLTLTNDVTAGYLMW